MKKLHLLGVCLLTVLSFNAQADDGKALHNENCMSCHQSEIYTRADHKVTSTHALKRQVSMCSQNLNMGWFPDEESAVVNFLDNSYYKFSK